MCQVEAIRGQVKSRCRSWGTSQGFPRRPAEATLERVPNPHPDTHYAARFTAPEFTCLCPVTGQPDFAHLVIDYVPADWLVESKSLKLYLAAFRNHGAFHEESTVMIGKQLVELSGAALPAHRRLLVPARRHADRRVLADGHAARRRVAARSGRRPLSRARLTRRRPHSCRPADARCRLARHAYVADWRDRHGSGSVRALRERMIRFRSLTLSICACAAFAGLAHATALGGPEPEATAPEPGDSRGAGVRLPQFAPAANTPGATPAPPPAAQAPPPATPTTTALLRQAHRAPDRGQRARAERARGARRVLRRARRRSALGERERPDRQGRRAHRRDHEGRRLGSRRQGLRATPRSQRRDREPEPGRGRGRRRRDLARVF